MCINNWLGNKHAFSVHRIKRNSHRNLFRFWNIHQETQHLFSLQFSVKLHFNIFNADIFESNYFPNQININEISTSHSFHSNESMPKMYIKIDLCVWNLMNLLHKIGIYVKITSMTQILFARVLNVLWFNQA